MSAFQLPAQTRARLLDGNYGPLLLDTKPFGCEPGSVYVLNEAPEHRHSLPDGGVIVVPAHPTREIRVTRVVRRTDGRWEVRFEVFDRRVKVRLLARGGGHTSSRFRAIDELEEVDEGWLDRKSGLVADQNVVLRLEREIAVLKRGIATLKTDLGPLGLDTRSELRAMERRLGEKLRKRAA